MAEKYRQFIHKSKKEEQQQFLHLQKISEEKSPNGIFGIVTSKSSKKKGNKMKSKNRNINIIVAQQL